MPGDSSSVLLDEGFTHEATSGYPGKATDDAKIAVRDAFHDARSDSTNQRKRPGDSAESERERKRFQEAAKESCDISIPENSERDILELSRSQLREHSERKSAIFFIELTPPSLARGARCQLMDCENKINVDDYRFAVCPGMNNVYGSSDFYHVKCFEKLVDLSKTEFLRRVEPLTRANCFARGLRMTAISSGNYLLDGGAERLVVYWVDSMRRLVAERDGIERKPCDVVLMDLLNRAGSASYTPKQPNNMSDSEYFKLRHSLATIESDGPEDKDEWNLIDQLVPLTFDGLDDLKETHSLSAMLRAWRARRFLACREEDKLSEKAKQVRKGLSDKAVRAIRRLSAIPMPDFQGAFFRE